MVYGKKLKQYVLRTPHSLPAEHDVCYRYRRAYQELYASATSLMPRLDALKVRHQPSERLQPRASYCSPRASL